MFVRVCGRKREWRVRKEMEETEKTLGSERENDIAFIN